MTANTDSNSANDANSALHASIEAKKDTSYYYAHKPRETGEQPAPLPVPELLHVEVKKIQEPVEPITSGYQFLDDGDKVKIYVPLEGVGSLNAESISSVFEERAFELSVRDYKPGKVLRLAIKGLYGSITTEECSHKKLSNKVVVTLVKADKGKWFNLKK